MNRAICSGRLTAYSDALTLQVKLGEELIEAARGLVTEGNSLLEAKSQRLAVRQLLARLRKGRSKLQKLRLQNTASRGRK